MKAIDQVLVEGQGEQFALLAPEVINDYVETLGKPCQNPLGYTAGSLILAKDLEGVQRMFKVTANISSSQNVVEGTNVERKKLEDLFDGIDQELGSVKQALADEVVTRQKYNVKNILNFNGTLTGSTVSTSATAVTGYVGTVHINQGEEFVFVCTQDSALTSNTRNTLLIDAPSRDVNDRIYEDGAITSDYHNEAGLHIIRFTATQTGDYDFYLWTHTLSSAITYSNFMLCTKADYDADPTYRPYVPTNAQCLSADANAVLGAHNFFINTDADRTISGIAITRNNDNSYSVAAGTTSGSGLQFPIKMDSNYDDFEKIADALLSNTTYVFSVGVADANMSLQVISWEDDPNVTTTLANATNVSEVSFTTPTTFKHICARIYIPISTAVPAMTLKPIIKLASDPSNKLTPYAMTNQQLTDKVTLETVDLAQYCDTDYVDTTGTFLKAYKVGKICIISGYFKAKVSLSSATVIATLPNSLKAVANEFIGSAFIGTTACSMNVSGASVTIKPSSIAANSFVSVSVVFATAE